MRTMPRRDSSGDTPYDGRMPKPAALVLPLLLGLAGIVAIVSGLATGSSLEGAEQTLAVETHYRKNAPLAPVIEVDGQRYVCEGSIHHRDYEEQQVLYDPADPSHCRSEQDVGRPSWAPVGFGAGAILLGLYLGLSGRRRS